MKFKFTLCAMLIIMFSGSGAFAAGNEHDNLSINTGIIFLLAVGLGLGIKIVSKKLKQVDKDLNDTFGEKIL